MAYSLIIDTREKYLLEKLTIPFIKQQLDIGDIQIRNEDSISLVIERKTIQDLCSSICDGRWKEQKARLLNSDINPENVLILLEGSLTVNRKISSATIQQTIINTQFRDKVKIHRTANINETIKYLEKLFESFQKNIFTTNNEAYAGVLKQKKSDNKTPEIWFTLQLKNIPRVSLKIAQQIVLKYKSCNGLINSYNKLSNEGEREKMLLEIESVGKTISKRIYHFYFN